MLQYSVTLSKPYDVRCSLPLSRRAELLEHDTTTTNHQHDQEQLSEVQHGTIKHG